jgi:hypothetical protein
MMTADRSTHFHPYAAHGKMDFLFFKCISTDYRLQTTMTYILITLTDYLTSNVRAVYS